MLGGLLVQDRYETMTVRPKQEKLPPSDGYNLLVVLGAPYSVNDDLPHLREEEGIIREFVESKRPVLGICLGSQLIAKAFGGRVYTGPKKEIGFYHDIQCDNEGLFAGFESPFTAFHWHNDTFELPQGSTRLASSTHYENQAFRYKTAVGLQFHLEVDTEMAIQWLDGAQQKGILSTDTAGKIRSEMAEQMPVVNQNMERFYANFKSEFGL
ncbi:GMP synthase, glutamine amidotransferase domain [Cenarchaeum symbiosum A]|uniref:GMP synthase, glutamine amidotransferase domain n=1 Tax=Cenarchaeum symbiosum (strain A) TaxID=414004 RepID=A0RTZ6_CENSY|nr:GMP synthase, glutamine amidotransferase domain [Cenarchaeum symbiosum A]